VDLTAQIVEAITAWLGTVAAQLYAPALASAGDLLFATPPFDLIPEVAETWRVMRNVADALLLLGITAAGILVMAAGSDARYSAKILIPRLVIAGIAANASLAVCGGLIRFENAMVVSFVGTSGTSYLLGQFASVALGQGLTELLPIALALAAAIVAILLIVVYIARDLLLLIATVLGPVALVMYALPHTEEVAQLWARAFAALLFVQVVQALLLRVALQLLQRTDWLGASSQLISGLLLLTLLYVLFKLPFVAYHWAFRRPVIRATPVVEVFLAARALRPVVR
jgi:hypothetical protein